MNIFILCVFALVPFHNASVHEANLTVCPDYAQTLRFQNVIASYQDPGPAPTPAPAAEPEAILVEQLEPEFVPERPAESEEKIVEKKPAVEPAPLEIPDELPSKSFSPSKNVQFATAEEPVPITQSLPAVQSTPAAVPVASNVAVVPADEPIRRPWGVLTFFIFLLLLSVSANVFLGWQLIEVRKVKLK